MPRLRGYIVAYTPRQTRIYITYILFGGLYTEVIICSKFPLVESCYFLFISGEEGYIGVQSPLFRNIYDFARSCGQKRIYIIYMGSCRAKYSYIAPRPRIWFVLGLRPRTNQILGLGAIQLYIALRDPIYTLHIYTYICVFIYIYIYTDIIDIDR